MLLTRLRVSLLSSMKLPTAATPEIANRNQTPFKHSLVFLRFAEAQWPPSLANGSLIVTS